MFMSEESRVTSGSRQGWLWHLQLLDLLEGPQIVICHVRVLSPFPPWSLQPDISRDKLKGIMESWKRLGGK